MDIVLIGLTAIKPQLVVYSLKSVQVKSMCLAVAQADTVATAKLLPAGSELAKPLNRPKGVQRS